jgi:N-acetylneuraminate synthase
MRRSLITTRPLKAGHILTESDIQAKRPGTGIPPTELPLVVGRRLRVDLGQEELILRSSMDD